MFPGEKNSLWHWQWIKGDVSRVWSGLRIKAEDSLSPQTIVIHWICIIEGLCFRHTVHSAHQVYSPNICSTFLTTQITANQMQAPKGERMGCHNNATFSCLYFNRGMILPSNKPCRPRILTTLPSAQKPLAHQIEKNEHKTGVRFLHPDAVTGFTVMVYLWSSDGKAWRCSTV